MKLEELTFRHNVQDSDKEAVKEIVSSTNFFKPYEIPVAVELVEEALIKGNESGYEFIFVELHGEPIAYACFGKTPCTKSSFDLYWIATLNSYRGLGIGKLVLQKTEKKISELNGKRIYIETSSTPLYLPTRNFYLNNGYKEEAVLENFYDDNDSKVIYSKVLL